MSTPALSARGLDVRLGGVQVLHGIDVEVRKGRWTSIVGPNGAGKSTLLKTLAGLLPFDGELNLLGHPMAQWRGRRRAAALSWLGQNEPGTDDLSCQDVVMLGRLPHQPWLAAPSHADHMAVEQALRACRAWPWRDRLMGQLSGGERQRVLLARALAVQAEVMLMDEPLTNLDPPHQSDWLALVRGLVQEGCTVVSVLHEISLALRADEMIIMSEGRIRHQGPCASAATHAALTQVFDHRIAIHRLDDQWLALPL